VKRFSDEAALESFIRDKNYGTPGFNNGTRIYAAIVIDRARPSLEYSIRMNSSEVPSTTSPYVNNLALKTDKTFVGKYLDSVISTTGPPFARNDKASAVELAPRTGFLSLQLLVDRWALNTSSASPPNIPALMQTLLTVIAIQTAVTSSEAQSYFSWFSSLPPNVSASVGAAVGDWLLPSEGLAPQTVDLVPFPTPQLTVNTYSSTMITVFSIIFVLGAYRTHM
jgi:hypothetical protein